jgi:hypothetical protein
LALHLPYNTARGAGEVNHTLKDSNELANQLVHDRRKGKRLFLNFSIEITGFDLKGNPFVERTRTEEISESGCCLSTRVPLKCGDLLDIKLASPGGEMSPEESAHQCEVLWVTEGKTGWSVGVRTLQREKIWKVSFPPSKSSFEPHSK